MAVATGNEYGLFINGETVEPASGELRELVEPATGETIGRSAMAGEADIDRAVAAARAAVDGPWGRTPPTERSRLLHALADAIQANRKELAELESRNVGKAISSVKAEVGGAVENFRFFASGDRLDRRTLEPDRRLAADVLAEGARRRRGADRPVELPAAHVGVEAVARARRGLLRRAEAGSADAAQCSAGRRARDRGGLPRRRDQHRSRRRPGAGAYLVKHPGVDKVAFTGSTKTGGEIMRLCSEPIKRLTLELGGKSPNLVFADAALDDAIPSSVWSIYYSAGQSCEARSRVLVEASLYDEFVSRFADYAKQIRVGDPLDPETQMGSLISTAHRDRVHGFVERGVKEGAEVVAGGESATARARSTADRAREGRQRDGGRAGGDLRPRRHGDPVRGREGRDPYRKRRALWPVRNGVDGRSRARAPGRARDQGRHGRHQHAVHRVPRNPVRRLQAVRLRARASIETLDSTSRRKAFLSRPARSRSIRSASSALALDVGVKLALVGLLVFAVARPDLPQFHGKSMTGRAIGYPIAALVVPLAWWIVQRRRRVAYPYAVDVLVVLPFLIDMAGNAANLYDTISWWDDVNHLVNWAILVGGFSVLLCAPVSAAWPIFGLGVGFGAVTAIIWELLEYVTFIRNSPELKTAYHDTLGDLALGLTGSTIAAIVAASVARKRV